MLNALVRNNNEPQRSKRAPLVLFIVVLFQIAFQNHSFFLFHFSLMLISSFTTFPFRNLTFLRTVEDRQLLNEIQRAADGPSTTTTNNDRNKLAGSSLSLSVSLLNNDWSLHCTRRSRLSRWDRTCSFLVPAADRDRGANGSIRAAGPEVQDHQLLDTTAPTAPTAPLNPASAQFCTPPCHRLRLRVPHQGRPGARQQPQLSC